MISSRVYIFFFWFHGLVNDWKWFLSGMKKLLEVI